MAFQIPRGVMPRTYISPHIKDVSHTSEESDHCSKPLEGAKEHHVGTGDKLTMNLRVGGEGISGNASCIEADRKKSMMAGVAFAWLVEACNSWILGSSSEIMRRIGSSGKLTAELDDKKSIV